MKVENVAGGVSLGFVAVPAAVILSFTSLAAANRFYRPVHNFVPYLLVGGAASGLFFSSFNRSRDGRLAFFMTHTLLGTLACALLYRQRDLGSIVMGVPIGCSVITGGVVGAIHLWKTS